MHHNTDAFGDTAPQDICISSTYWMMGPAWLCTHFWTHYEYTGDREFLKKIFPVMLEAALFYLDFLVEKDGVLGDVPVCISRKYLSIAERTEGCGQLGVTRITRFLGICSASV